MKSLSEAQRAEAAPKVERMVNWWMSRCPPYVDRDDAMSAAWEGVCRAADRFDPALASWPTYALIRAKGSMIDWFRKEHVISRTTPLIRQSVEWHEFSPQEVTPEDQHGTILSEHVLFRLQTLPERTQAIILSYYWGGLTQKEVAVRFDLTEPRVSQIIKAVLRRLKQPNYELGDDHG